MRDPSLDLGKGLAILFVYLGHSILYHPIAMASMYNWCHVLQKFIISFNMPMFFIISGYLFSKTKKNTAELYLGKNDAHFGAVSFYHANPCVRQVGASDFNVIQFCS